MFIALKSRFLHTIFKNSTNLYFTIIRKYNSLKIICINIYLIICYKVQCILPDWTLDEF